MISKILVPSSACRQDFDALIVCLRIGIAFVSNPFGVYLIYPFFIYFNLFGHNYSIWVISDILAVLWIVWCMNIVGWSAGVEGQLPGFVAIAAVFLGILGMRFASDFTQWPVIILAAAVSGAYFGFLPFNFFPQKIMHG
jgi:UDP-GlcNAc:undecaprenyl-phosphate GlcNAc-1-phosphate transferase